MGRNIKPAKFLRIGRNLAQRAWLKCSRWGASALTIIIVCSGGLFFSADTATAICPPGVTDGKSAPTPVMPNTGLTGSILPKPSRITDADPFNPANKVSILQTYGLNWATWDTYDLGCGGDVRNPQASTDTGIGNAVLGLPKVVAALTASLAKYAYEPSSWLAKLDPAVTSIAKGLQRGIASPLSPLAIIFAGVALIWAASRLKLATALTMALGVVLALTIAYFTADAPTRVGSATDSIMQSASKGLNSQINGRSDSAVADPGSEAVSPFIDHVLYNHWLAGQLGSSNSATAKKYGPELFRAKAISWAEAERIKNDPDKVQDLFDDKNDKWEETAEKIKDEDPDAYAYLTGKRTNRTAESLWTLAATYTMLFPIFAFLLMMAGYLVVRFIVMTGPAWATIAIIPALQGTMRSALGVVAAAVINPIIMAAGASVSVLVTGFLLNPDTGLGWLGLLLSVLFSALMWLVLKPYRRLTSLVTGNPLKEAGDNINSFKEKAGGFARTAAAAAFGAATGAKIAQDDEDAGKRSELSSTESTNGAQADRFRRPMQAIDSRPVEPVQVWSQLPAGGSPPAALPAAGVPQPVTMQTRLALTSADLPAKQSGSTMLMTDSPRSQSRLAVQELTVEAEIVITDSSQQILQGEVIRRPEPIVVDGQELNVIYTPELGVSIDDSRTNSEDRS